MAELPSKYFKGGKLKSGYIKTAAPIEGLDLQYKYKGTEPVFGYFKGVKKQLVAGDSPFYIYKEPVAAAKAATKKIFDDQSKQVAASLAETMKIADQAKADKSAAQQMIENYTKMMEDEAAAKKAAQEEAAAALKISEANKAKAALTPNLQIAPAAQAPQTAGTQAFKYKAKPKPAANLGGLPFIMPQILNV